MSIVPTTALSPFLLVVDSSDRNRRSIIEALPARQFKCIQAKDGLTAWAHYLQHRPCAVVTAVDLLGLQASELLNRVRAHSTTAFVLYSTVNDARIASKFMRAGADDFFLLPDDVPTIASRLQTMLATTRDPNRNSLEAIIVGQSRPIARLRDQLISISTLRIPILFRAAPGAGADHAARTLARLAFDDAHSFIPLRPGRMRSPETQDWGRVIYLDRVENLSLSEQGQWFNQVKRCERGDTDAPHRVIASSAADLHQLATAGRFDPNLAQQLVQFSIAIPPLRERVEDIGLLAGHFAAEIALEIGRRRMVVTAPAIRLLQMQPWPENVRELRLLLAKLVAFAINGRITHDDVERELLETRGGVKSMRETREQKSREELVAILEATGGNLAEAARELGMSRGGVTYRARKFGLLAKQIGARP